MNKYKPNWLHRLTYNLGINSKCIVHGVSFTSHGYNDDLWCVECVKEMKGKIK